MPSIQWKLYSLADAGPTTIEMEIALDGGQLHELWELIWDGNMPSDIACQLSFLADRFAHSYHPGEVLDSKHRHCVKVTLEVPHEN